MRYALPACLLVLAASIVALCAQPAPAPMGPPVAPAAAQDESIYATPEMFGAKGNDNVDDTEALKTLFAGKHGKVIFIPAKEYLISDTLVLPKRSGIRVQGVASGVQYQEAGKALLGNISRLVWIGEPGKPMVEYRGSGLVWDGVALYGKRTLKTEKRASIGFLVHKTSKGLGTGKAHFRQINIFHCDVGFQVGATPGEHNCDNLVFDFFNVGACDTGYLVKNDMGMDHSFKFARSYGCETIFHFERGGALYVHSAGVHHPANKVLLRIGWAGKNNAQYYLGNIKFDAQLSDFKFILMDEPIPAFITLNNLKRSYRYARDPATGKVTGRHGFHPQYDLTKTFQLKGNTKLLIENSNGIITKGCFLTETGHPEGNENEAKATPLILVHNSLVHATADELLHPDSHKDTKLRVLNCFDYRGEWVEDKVK